MMPVPGGSNNRTQRTGLVSWCLYDWANSAFPTIITTFVFSVHFTQMVASDPIQGAAQWSYAVAAAALVVAIGAPALGAVADNLGRRKPWLSAFTLLTLACTAALRWVKPSPQFTLLALVRYAAAAASFGFAMIFYDAMLRSIAPPGYLGRLSGWGWSLGYAGGPMCLVAALLGLLKTDPPPFGLEAEQGEHVRATSLLAAAWFALFSIPIFVFTPDQPSAGISVNQAVRTGISGLLGSLRRILQHGDVARFLLAHMLYSNGINTLFSFGGIYAAGTFDMSLEEVLYFGIVLNVTASRRRGVCLDRRLDRIETDDPDRAVRAQFSWFDARACPIGNLVFRTGVRLGPVRGPGASRGTFDDGKAGAV